MFENPISPANVAAILADSKAVPIDLAADDVFDGWIAGARLARRSVPIYGRPDLYAQYEDLTRQLKVAEASAEDGEMAGTGVARIEQSLQDLYDQWMASKSLWILESLSSERIEALNADEPALVAPIKPVPPVEPAPVKASATSDEQRRFAEASKAYQAAVAAHRDALAEYSKANAEHQAESALRIVAAAVVEIQMADGRTQASITVDQLRVLRDRLGAQQIARLSQAAVLASLKDPEIPAPFSRRNSSTDTTS